MYQLFHKSARVADVLSRRGATLTRAAVALPTSTGTHVRVLSNAPSHAAARSDLSSQRRTFSAFAVPHRGPQSGNTPGAAQRPPSQHIPKQGANATARSAPTTTRPGHTGGSTGNYASRPSRVNQPAKPQPKTGKGEKLDASLSNAVMSLPHNAATFEYLTPNGDIESKVSLLTSALRPIVTHEGVMPLKELPDMKVEIPQEIQNWPRLITPPDQVVWERIPPFITSSRDPSLVQLAKKQGVNFMSSTSSSTPILSQMHFALTRFQPINMQFMSHWFRGMPTTHTRATVKPSSSILRRRGLDLWGMDSLPSGSPKPNQILIELGKSMERQLTMDPELYDKLLVKKYDEKGNVINLPTDPEDKLEDDAHKFVKTSKMLLRSQLDCADPNVPGKRKVFDLKTRATLPIRLDVMNHKDYLEYHIVRQRGLYSSFEREWYDMARSAFLKYSLQCRIGDMAGVFVAYHNTQEIFGCEYISLERMDESTYGSPYRAQQVYGHLLRLTEASLLRVVKENRTDTRPFMNDSIRVTAQALNGHLLLYVEKLPPMENVPNEAYHNASRPEQDEGPELDTAVYERIEGYLKDLHNGSLYVDLLSTRTIRRLLERRGLKASGSRAIVASRLEEAYAPRFGHEYIPTRAELAQAVKNGYITMYRLDVDMLQNGQLAPSLSTLQDGDALDVLYCLRRANESPSYIAAKYHGALSDYYLRFDHSDSNLSSQARTEASQMDRRRRVQEILNEHIKYEAYLRSLKSGTPPPEYLTAASSASVAIAEGLEVEE